MPIIRITKQVVENAKKASETALKEDPDFRASEEELERQEKEAREQREKEVSRTWPSLRRGRVMPLEATFSLTPRESYYWEASGKYAYFSIIYGATFSPNYNPVYSYSFDHQHANDMLYFDAYYVAEPTLDYSNWGNRLMAPHIHLTYDLSSMCAAEEGAAKELALIVDSWVTSLSSRLLIYTDAGLLSDETLAQGDNQFTIEVESLDYMNLYFIHVRKQNVSGFGGNWFFKGITGYVV